MLPPVSVVMWGAHSIISRMKWTTLTFYPWPLVGRDAAWPSSFSTLSKLHKAQVVPWKGGVVLVELPVRIGQEKDEPHESCQGRCQKRQKKKKNNGSAQSYVIFSQAWIDRWEFHTGHQILTPCKVTPTFMKNSLPIIVNTKLRAMWEDLNQTWIDRWHSHTGHQI